MRLPTDHLEVLACATDATVAPGNRFSPALVGWSLATLIAVLCLGAGASAPGLVQGASDTTATVDAPAVLLSRQLMEAEDLAVGDIVHLSADPSGTEPRPFRIVETYEPTPDPMRIGAERLEARLHLPDLLALTADLSDPLSTETVSAINVALASPDDARAFARDLSAKVPGLIVRPTAREASPSDPFVVIERFHLAIAIVTVIASTVFLLALMVMRAEERRETVGILRLIGLTKGRVLLQVFAEGLLIAVAGALFGILLSVALQGAFNRFFQWRYDTALVFVRITPAVAWRSVALAVPLGILASIVASWTLLRRDILALVRR